MTHLQVRKYERGKLPNGCARPVRKFKCMLPSADGSMFEHQFVGEVTDDACILVRWTRAYDNATSSPPELNLTPLAAAAHARALVDLVKHALWLKADLDAKR